MKDFLLTLPAPVRHIVLTIAAAVLAWLGTDVVGPLSDQPQYGPLAAALLLAFLAYATPLVTSYGVGADRAKELGARTPSDDSGQAEVWWILLIVIAVGVLLLCLGVLPT